MKSISEETQATSLTKNDLLLISQWDGVSAYNSRFITADLCESVDKKIFIASIEQSGVSAPLITVIKDDFGDTYSTSYVSAGNYEISGFNGELLGDEEIIVNVNNLPVTYFLRTSAVGTNSISITTTDISGTATDAVIFVNTYIKVIKYL